MYQPNYIIIKNFGSIADMRYDFIPNVSQVIQGKNLDDRGQKGNGVGKSSFNDAIGFGLSGISLRGLTMDDLIRDGENESFLEFSLNTIDQTKHLLIQRTLNRKKPQVIRIFLNDKPLHKDEHDVNARNKTILDQIDISQKDLFQFFIINKERFKPYFKLSDNDKKEITGRFSNADKVDKVFPKIESDLQVNEMKIIALKSKVSQIEGKLETYKSEQDNYVNNAQDKKEKLKASLVDSISYKQGIINVINSQIKENENLILSKNKEILEFKTSIITLEQIETKEALLNELVLSFEKLEEKFLTSIKVIEKEIEIKDKIKLDTSKELIDLNKDLYDLNTLSSQIDSKLQSAIQCPACEHEFVLSSDETVEELQEKLKECNDIMSEIQIDMKKIEKSIQHANIEIQALNEQIKTLKLKQKSITEDNQKQQKIIRDYLASVNSSNQRIERTIISFENEVIRLEQNNISNLESIKIHTNKINELKQEIIDIENEKDNNDAIGRYTQLIKESEDDLKESNENLSELMLESQRLNAWILRFKSFKSFLANQSVKNIEDLANSYLQKMNTDLTISISAHKKDKKVVKEKFTEQILRKGFVIGSYGRFSGGERGRIDMSLILANQALINSNSNEGLDFVLIDEVLESLDALGIESIVKAMDGIDKTLLLVSQNEINTLPKQTLTLIKKNGTTEIE